MNITGLATYLTKPMLAFRGNVIGQYPYKVGAPCSKCASGKGFCYKKLCRK